MSNRETPILISYSSKGREDYNKALLRNIEYAKEHHKGDFLYYSKDAETLLYRGVTINEGMPYDCDEHSVTPYQFKPKLFKQAYDKGYRKIIWTDSTICIVKDLAPIFNKMNKTGVLAFHNLGHDLDRWISGVAAKNIGIDLTENPYQIMACVVGFDLGTVKGKRIFDKWYDLSMDGESFQNNAVNHPGGVAHRHDQACLSALLWQEKHKLLPYGKLIYEAHETNKEFGDDYYFVNRAI